MIIKELLDHPAIGHVRRVTISSLLIASSILLLASCGGDEKESTTKQTSGPAATPTPSGDLFDFGDAPDPLYPTKLESNGARHIDVTRAWMGEEVDVEVDANQQEDVLAYTGDEADDGLVAALPLEFSVTNIDWDGPLYINLLLDFNGDGDWDDADEWAIQNMEIEVSMGVIKEFPTDLVFGPDLHLRMTLTGSPLTDYNGTGEFDIGETEDHMWTAARTGGSF